MPDFGHGVADPVLVLESLDLFLDQISEMLAGHLAKRRCPAIGNVLELQRGFLDVSFDGV